MWPKKRTDKETDAIVLWQCIDGKKKNRRSVIWVSWNIDTHELKWCTIARSYYEAVNSMGLGEMPVGYARGEKSPRK